MNDSKKQQDKEENYATKETKTKSTKQNIDEINKGKQETTKQHKQKET